MSLARSRVVAAIVATVLVALALGAILLGAQAVARARNGIVEVEADERPAREVLAEIARQSGRDLVTDESLNDQRVTVSLHNARWNDAVEVVARQIDAEVDQQGTVLLVTRPLHVDVIVRDADAREVLLSLERQAGITLQIDPDVEGRVTCELKNMRWIRALVIVARSIGCEVVDEGRPRLVRVLPARKISRLVQVNDDDVRAALERAAAIDGVHVVLDDDVKGTVTARASSPGAVAQIANAAGFLAIVDSGTVHVVSRATVDKLRR